ncbi:uncharacterized protein LOC141679540 [Apium graveolens]|uniref:uncharacterized protein LOC141679540 n=1 Tax=Apium graveolens TaxID=4045 RepID=UPI003D7B6A4B
MKLVTTPFGGTAYENWKRSMVIGLTAKNKMSFIDVTLLKPDANAPEFKSWSRCNSMKTGWIITALEPQILKNVWDEIDNLKPLSACTCTNCTCHITQKVLKLQQDKRWMIFLKKISNEFANVRSHILVMDNLPNLPQAYRMLLQEQRHKEISKVTTTSQESVAFSIDKIQNSFKQLPASHKINRSSTGRPYSGYNTNNSAGFQQQRRPTYFCDRCKIPGHRERCFKLIGYPPEFKMNQQSKFAVCVTIDNTEESQIKDLPDTSSQNPSPHAQSNNTDQDNSFSGNALLAGTYYCLLSSVHTNKWIIDSGALDHICSSIGFFHTVKEILDSNFITILDGTKIRVTHIGNIKLNNFIELTDVLFAPTFRFNLISVPKLVHNTTYSVYFTSGSCLLQEHSMSPPKLLGKLFQGLYFFDEGFFSTTAVHSLVLNKASPSIVSTPMAHATVSSHIDEAKLLYLRLGHGPYSKLSTIVKHIDFTVLNDCLCTICPAARQHRFSFRSSEIKITRIFELLHLDVWGPYHVTTHTGCKYFLTIVDDFSRATWSRTKFDPRAHPCVFHGYPEATKGYKILDLVTHRYHHIDVPDNFYEPRIPSTTIPSADSSAVVEIPVRKSTRQTHTPSHLRDYASLDPNWVQAMKLEIQALELNNTWDIVDLPPGKRPIGCKWVFKTKLKADGSIERFKARLVAKGFNQKYGIDYHETFSPVVKMATVRSTNLADITAFKEHLHKCFGIKDLGYQHFFLGFEVGYTDSGITLTQVKFTKELLVDSSISVFKKVATPLPLNLKLSANTGEPYSDPAFYQALVGKLIFLTNIRPDLSYFVQTLSQFMHSPKLHHFDALQHVLHYVVSTAGQGIFLKGSDALTLQAYSDSDWAACPNTRRSLEIKKQTTVSKSSSEAEYRAMVAAASEVAWLVRLFGDIGITNLQPITLFCDDQSAMHIAKNPAFHERTKHIDIDCHFTRDKALEGLIELSYLPTTDQLADLLTKILPSPHFNELKSKFDNVLNE